MLPVNPNSKLSAQDFVDNVKQTNCLPDWMKSIFTAKGHDLQIAEKYTFPKTSKPPAWFETWRMAAYTAWQQDEWELTTGALQMKPKGLSIMVPDGVSIGKTDPDGNWIEFPQIGADDSGTGGIVVPTESIKNDLNGLKDAKLHYSGVTIKPGKTGKSLGAIVIVDRFKTETGELLKMNADEITGTLFHELFHAGQISQGKPNSHQDDRFEKVIQVIESQFKHCTP